MNIRDIHLLYEYNCWANKKLLTASASIPQGQFIKPASFPYGGLHGTLLHTLDAEWGWRALFQKLDDASDLLPAAYPDLSTIESRWHTEETAMRAYLATLHDKDMESHLRYTTDTGIERDRILWHCLLHVVNHGTQHRSEAAALLTDFGASPDDLDFTVFLNERRS
jgi:uncharacterized damage-inducible protein DinB